jgi:uroporphyrinogen III methyltransferase/synthase
LETAEVVVYDHLIGPQLLALCDAQARRVYVGKSADERSTSQQRINRLLVRLARQGRQVVRLKGGDPFVFGRGGEEVLALAQSRIPFEVVPGVSSAVAVPAYAGIPVTHRGLASSVTFFTGHEDPGKRDSSIDWAALARSPGTLVCLMAVGRLPGIIARLRQEGRLDSTPCALIERGTWPQQRTLTGTLGTMAASARHARVQAPAILVIGNVVRLRPQVRWAEQRPLFGRRVLITRAMEKGSQLAEQLMALGADVTALPTVVLRPVPLTARTRAALAQIPQTDWVFFTSAEGIVWLQDVLRRVRKDVRWLKGCHLAAIGPKTALSLRRLGLQVDFTPRRYQQEGVLKDLPRQRLQGKRAMLFNAAGSRDVLEQGLRRLGMQVTRVPVYRTLMPRALQARVAAACAISWDAVTATSASSAEHLYQALPKRKRRDFKRLPFVSIGPITSAAVRARGGRVVAQAKQATMEGLVEALCRYLK